MIAKSGPALYRLNLIRELRDREYKAERQQRMAVIVGLGCFGLFILSLLYSGLTIMQMEGVLKTETLKLSLLRQEYKKYTASKLIVDKSDIELLSTLQGKGIFWTRKMAALAQHLPENYQITRFKFDNEELRVSGFGYVPPQQDQLLVLDGYLNSLRADTAFSDIFKTVQLLSADIKHETGGGRVAFEFTAVTSKSKKKKK